MLPAVCALALVVIAQVAVGRADPGLDASFLDALTKAGITIKSETGAVKAAKTACGLMAQGRPELEVVDLVTKQNPGLDTTRAAQFTAIAASAYCPQFLQRPAGHSPTTTTPPNTG
jgi:UDP-N-acetylglucosamine enolpyruvyl transferase